MNFIELTEMTGKKRLINADMIVYIYPCEGGVGVENNIGLNYFRESYEKLKEMLLPFEISFGGDNGVLNCAKGEE